MSLNTSEDSPDYPESFFKSVKLVEILVNSEVLVEYPVWNWCT